jgi:hypothetical protein
MPAFKLRKIPSSSRLVEERPFRTAVNDLKNILSLRRRLARRAAERADQSRDGAERRILPFAKREGGHAAISAILG